MSDKKNATGKSSTAKPNTNAGGQMDIDSESVSPEAITEEGLAAARAEEAPKNEAATKREEA
jgi:hypothetical protein